jgi:fimbrial chaperone protein
MRKYCYSLLFFLSFCLTIPAYSFQFKPITADFTPTGKHATRSFLVSNEGKKSVAIQISVLTRDVDLDGNENREEVDDFIIYPSQLILLPGDAQTVRVSWAGTTNPEKELAFRIVGEQLPIFVEEEAPTNTASGQFNIAMRYVGAIYVIPEGVSPEVVIDSANMLKDEDGSDALEIVFHNKGTAHQLLKNVTLEITSKTTGAEGGMVKLTEIDIPALPATNLLAGFKRRFIVKWPEELPKGDVDVTLIIK